MSKKEINKKNYDCKIITDYEVEGCWSSGIPICRCCGAKQVRVIDEKHYNAKYLILQRNDGMFLYCCPNGCFVGDAEEKMKMFLLVSRFCTKDSHSYKWLPDFTKFNSCWINPDGIIYPVETTGHNSFAEEIGHSERYLELQDWIKISNTSILNNINVTQKQRDALFDFAMANGYETKPLFDEYIPVNFTRRFDIIKEPTE